MCRAQVPGYVASTIAGQGGPAAAAALIGAAGIALDPSGNAYISDGSSMVYKLSPQGVVTAVAGGGKPSQFLGDGGPATSATLVGPQGVALDRAGNLYIADTLHNRIRKVATDGTITTTAGGSSSGPLGDGGPATSAVLAGPRGITVDTNGNIYFADTGSNRVRKIAPDGTITTVAGNGKAGPNGTNSDGGPATSAQLTAPAAVALDSSGNLYVTDALGLIHKLSTSGTISTVAGNGNIVVYYGDGGPAKLAGIGSSMAGLAVDSAGTIYVSDRGNFVVRAITADGNIYTIAGNNAAAQKGSFPPVAANTPALSAVFVPGPLAVGSGGAIYVASLTSILRLTPSSTTVFPAPSVAPTSGVTEATAFGTRVGGPIALGGWVEIYGNYLASNTRTWAGTDFNGSNAPVALDGTSVMIGGQPAFVSYISPGQVNVQVPSTIGTGPQPLVISTAHGQSSILAVPVNAEVPGLLAPSVFNINGTQYGVALFPDGVTFALPVGAIPGVPSRPAKEGDTLTFYGIGFGPTTPNIPAGQIAQGSSSLMLPLKVSILGTAASVTYNGLAPGNVGLYQFNVVIPKLPAVGPQFVTFNLGAAGQVDVVIATQ
jgi:uncharacterized protein (TIGR03437 family)